MNSDELSRALRDSVTDEQVRPVPLVAIHRRVRRGRLAVTAAVVGSTAAVSFLAAVAGSSLVHGGTGADGADRIAAAPTSSSSPGPSEYSTELPWSPDHLWDGDPNNTEAMAGTIQLKDCPDALKYALQPAAVAYFVKYYGGALGPDSRFKGGCPTVAQLRSAVESLTPPSPPPSKVS